VRGRHWSKRPGPIDIPPVWERHTSAASNSCHSECARLLGKRRAGCAPVIDVSPRGEAQYRGDHRDRPRDRSLSLGNCTRGRACVGHTTTDLAAAHPAPWISKGVNASKEDNSCARLGTGPRWGTPERRLEASHVPMPVVRAPDGNRKCGIQPAHQSRSTDVQRSRLLPCTATSTSGSSHAERAGWTNAPSPLESGHQSREARPASLRLEAQALRRPCDCP
jgi:hypothetical protein